MPDKKVRTRIPRPLRVCLYALLLAFVCMVFSPLSAAACGGLFTADNYTEQSAERLIFTVDQNQTTLYEQITYTGSPKDFAWILPVPANPKVETAPITMFRDLDWATAPTFNISGYTPPDCGLDFNRGTSAGAPPSSNNSEVNVYSSGAIGPYNYDVISSNNSQALTQWLNGHHYKIPDESKAEMQPYIEAHMLFLAMRLKGSASTQDIQPIKVTYASKEQQVSIPLRMATPMGKENLNVLVWVFANSRYAPQNYQAVSFTNRDFSNVADPYSGFYQTKVKQVVTQAKGHAFITEYAQPTQGTSFSGDLLLTTLQQHYSYLTRMFTSLAPAQIDLDPIFTAQTGKGDVSRYLTVSNTLNGKSINCIGNYAAIAGGLVVGTAVVALFIIFLRRKIRPS